MELPDDELHLWILSLADEVDGPALDTLSREERWRAARFRFAHDRRRYLAAHLALRRTLAPYVGQPPESLTFERGEWGKPRLAGANGPRFNLSHSSDVALLAIAASREVGADLERVRPMPGCLDLARAYFAPGEREALGAVEEPERDQMFLRLWTRKEALVKGAGMGLELPLDAFTVPLQPNEAEVAIPDAGTWGVRTEAVLPEYVASVATQGALRVWRYHNG